MGMLDAPKFEQITKDKRTPVDDSSFAQMYQALQSNYQGQDPIDRRSVFDAQQVQDAYASGDKDEYERLTSPGANMPSPDNQFPFTKSNEKYNVDLSIDDGVDENGNPKTSTYGLRPLKTYGYNEAPQYNQDNYNQMKKAYEQYGPSVMQYLFK